MGPPATITINVDPVLHLGGLGIHWYGVMYVTAFVVAYQFGVRPHLGRRGVPAEVAERLTGWVIVFGLLGARLYYVVQSSPPQGGSWLRHPEEILAVWHGGMAFFGAIIGGFACIAVLARRHHLSFWLLADAAVLFAVIGQPIGRIGNVINGDILGASSSLPWATRYLNPNAVLQPGFSLGTPYQPAAVYEALGAILIGVILFGLRARGVRDGVLALTYTGLYALSQLVIFQWRASEPTVGLGLKQAQWTAIVGLVVVLPLGVLAWRRGLLDFSAPPPTDGEPGSGTGRSEAAAAAPEPAPLGAPPP